MPAPAPAPAPAAAPAAAPMWWFPDRKVIATGLTGIASWLILTVLAHYGINLPVDPTVLSSILGWLAGYIIPPSQQDIVRRLNDKIVAIAAADPSIPVSGPLSDAPKS
jgi:hypothetical protein